MFNVLIDRKIYCIAYFWVQFNVSIVFRVELYDHVGTLQSQLSEKKVKLDLIENKKMASKCWKNYLYVRNSQSDIIGN